MCIVKLKTYSGDIRLIQAEYELGHLQYQEQPWHFQHLVHLRGQERASGTAGEFHGEQNRSPNKVNKPACCLAGQPPLHSDLVRHQQTSSALLLKAYQHQQLQEEADNMQDCAAGCIQQTCK